MLVVDDYMKPKPKAECKLWKCTGCLENNKNKNKKIVQKCLIREKEKKKEKEKEERLLHFPSDVVYKVNICSKNLIKDSAKWGKKDEH